MEEAQEVSTDDDPLGFPRGRGTENLGQNGHVEIGQKTDRETRPELEVVSTPEGILSR